MSELLTIRIAGEFGVNFDLEPCDLPPEMFSAGNNFVVRNNKIASYNGSTLISSIPTHFKGSKVLVLGAPSSSGRTPNVVVGTWFYLVMGRTAVQCYDGAVWANISSTAGYATISEGGQYLWTDCVLGEIPIVNNPQVHPEYWSPAASATKLRPLPWSTGQTWAQQLKSCNIIRAHKNFLFALGMTEGSSYEPDSYRWSHPADSGTVPFTWDETDVSALAGKASILGNAGQIIDGQSLRDAFCIYSQRGITILDYVGGDFIWQARSLSGTSGLLATNCIVDIAGSHLILSDADVLLNDGNTIRSTMTKVMKKKLEGYIDEKSYALSYAVANPSAYEAWFCIPSTGSTYPNKAFIYNWKDDKWSLRDINRHFTGATYGPIAIADETWEGTSGAWSTDTRPWNYGATSPFSNELIGVNTDNSALYNIADQDGTTNMATTLERLSVVFGTQYNVTRIVSVYPHIRSTGLVELQFGSQDQVGGGTRWMPWVTFDPTHERKIDVMSTGKLHSWRIRSVGVDPFTYSGMDIEFYQAGVR